jgi:hypothetical protein
MFEETESVLNTKSVALNILQNLEFTHVQNSYCDHRNFDSVNQPLDQAYCTCSLSSLIIF